MNILTLIPSANVYGLMLLAMLSLGSFNIARHIHIRWLKNTLSFVATNAVVKCSIVALGFTIIPVIFLFPINIYMEIVSIILGMLFGCATIFIEVMMVRKANRKKLDNKNSKQIKQDSNNSKILTINKALSLSSTSAINAKGIIDIRKNYAQHADNPDFLNYSLLAVIAVAIAEEFLFRGYLISIAYCLHSSIITVVIILLSVFAFAYSHVSNSWRECIYKLPLSLFTTINFIITGSLLGAIVNHVILNGYAYIIVKKVVSAAKQNNAMQPGVYG